MSELFLMGWAVIATVFAVYYHHIGNRLVFELNCFKFGLVQIAEGKAEVSMQGNSISIKSIDQESV
jgi:uncharacterized membrane protein YhdT